MAQRREVRWSELKVGLLALASLSLLTVVVFLITGQRGLFSESLRYRAYSPDAGG